MATGEAALHGAGAERRGRAIAFAVTGILCFTLADAGIKWLSADVPTMMIVFVLGFCGIFSSTAVPVLQDGLNSLATRRPGLQLLRGLLMCVSMGTVFLALGMMPLADVVAMSYSTPLFVAVLAVPLLKERLRPVQMLAILVGFAGVLIVARPGETALALPALLIVTGSVSYALAMIVTRWMRTTESPASQMFYSHLTVTTASALTLPWFWTVPEAAEAALMIGIGLLNGLAHYCVMCAYRHAPAAVVAPFDYTAILWGAFFGYVIWAEVPGWHLWAGAALIVASTLVVARTRAAA